MTYSDKAARIAVSDVDGTIVRRSLVLNHAVNLHESGVIDLGDLGNQWLAQPKNEILISALAESYRDQIAGKTVEDLKVREYIDSLVSHDGNFYSTLERLKKLQGEGVEVVLISGSPSFLVEPFGAHYGFASAGSDYLRDSDGRFTGECIGMFTGGAKREYLKQLGLERYSEILAFGDTQSDAPLFESAHYSVLVEPTEETHKALAGHVNEVIHD